MISIFVKLLWACNLASQELPFCMCQPYSGGAVKTGVYKYVHSTGSSARLGSWTIRSIHCSSMYSHIIPAAFKFTLAGAHRKILSRRRQDAKKHIIFYLCGLCAFARTCFASIYQNQSSKRYLIRPFLKYIKRTARQKVPDR